MVVSTTTSELNLVGKANLWNEVEQFLLGDSIIGGDGDLGVLLENWDADNVLEETSESVDKGGPLVLLENHRSRSIEGENIVSVGHWLGGLGLVWVLNEVIWALTLSKDNNLIGSAVWLLNLWLELLLIALVDEADTGASLTAAAASHHTWATPHHWHLTALVMSLIKCAKMAVGFDFVHNITARMNVDSINEVGEVSEGQEGQQ